jgi:hypothetical protein
MQLFRRLRDEYHYGGGYDQVRRYVGKHRRDRRETFIPLAHDPGQRLECDFGHIHVDFPDGRRLVPVLVAAWAYSTLRSAIGAPSAGLSLVGLRPRSARLRFTRPRQSNPRAVEEQDQARGWSRGGQPQ